MIKVKPQEIYLRYLKSMSSLEKLQTSGNLDILELQLLNAIALRVRDGERLMIGDITLMREIASPATLNTRLKSLRAKKMIKFVLGDDDRKKYVEPSDIAYKYFDQVGALMNKAVATKK